MYADAALPSLPPPEVAQCWTHVCLSLLCLADDRYVHLQCLLNLATVCRAEDGGVLFWAPGHAPHRHRGAARHLHERLLHAHAARNQVHQLLHQCVLLTLPMHAACPAEMLVPKCLARSPSNIPS